MKDFYLCFSSCFCGNCQLLGIGGVDRIERTFVETTKPCVFLLPIPHSDFGFFSHSILYSPGTYCATVSVQ